MRNTCAPTCWSLLDNIPGFYVSRKRRTVLSRTPRWLLHPSSNDRFAVVRFAVLAVTLRGPPVPDADPLEMCYDSNSDPGHE